MSFRPLGLASEFENFFKENNLKTPTDVQRQVVPLMLQRKSVLAVSETGSGKTLSFVLPIVHMLREEEQKHGGVTLKSTPRALVLAPTRELATQIYDVLKSVSHHAKLRVRQLSGGDSHARTKSLAHSVYDVLVATPSRVKSAVRHKELSLGHVKTLILDEADNLFEMGFKKDIEQMLADLDLGGLQLGFFTATMPRTFEEFLTVKFADKKIERVTFDDAHRPQSRIETYNVRVTPQEKDQVVRMFLEKEAKGRGIVFTNQKNQAESVFKYLGEKMPNLKCRLLHGDMTSAERETALEAFLEKKVQVLVATDVAARGIDVPDLMWVVNYGLPKSAIYYLHRCGRVGRGNKHGVVYNLVAPHDGKMILEINEAIKLQTHLPLNPIPEEKVKRTGDVKAKILKPSERKTIVRTTKQGDQRSASRGASATTNSKKRVANDAYKKSERRSPRKTKSVSPKRR
jgi:superfamily II DNA/RNA helicase